MGAGQKAMSKTAKINPMTMPNQIARRILAPMLRSVTSHDCKVNGT